MVDPALKPILVYTGTADDTGTRKSYSITARIRFPGRFFRGAASITNLRSRASCTRSRAISSFRLRIRSRRLSSSRWGAGGAFASAPGLPG